VIIILQDLVIFIIVFSFHFGAEIQLCVCVCVTRFQDELETNKLMENKEKHLSLVAYEEMSEKHKVEKDAIGKSGDGRELSRVFSEDYDSTQILILDPRGPTINTWNKIFLAACLLSLFVDPLFFYLPVAKKEKCIDMSTGLEVFLTIIRSLIDAFYIIQIYFRFQTAYIAPSSRVSGRGELIIDSSKIASNYMRKDFWLDLVAAQPLPQVSLPHTKFAFIFPLIQKFLKFVIHIHILGINLGRNSKSKRVSNDCFKACFAPCFHFPVPLEVVSYLSSVI